MNQLSVIRNNVKTQEGSTKRGFSAVVTGIIVLYMVFKGQPVDFDTILQAVIGKVDFWVGLGLNVMGFMGIFIPDEPKTVKIELPPIELVSQSLSAQEAAATRNPVVSNIHDHHHSADERLREPGLPARPTAQLERPASRDESPPPSNTGWNG